MEQDETKPMARVVVSRAIVGIAGMQVCACKDATDEEILVTANRDNPSGVSHGWVEVVRTVVDGSMYKTEQMQPVQCTDYPDRMHFICVC